MKQIFDIVTGNGIILKESFTTTKKTIIKYQSWKLLLSRGKARRSEDK